VTLRGGPTTQGRIKVTCANSIFFNVSLGNFTALDGPYLTASSASNGTTAGGTRLTLSGANLSGATSAKVGATSADFEVLSSSQVVITTPVGAHGAVYSVSVQTPDGNAILDEAFEYIDSSIPTVTPTPVTPTPVTPTPVTPTPVTPTPVTPTPVTPTPVTPTPVTPTPVTPPVSTVVDESGGTLTSGGVMIQILPQQVGNPLTVTLVLTTPAAPPNGTQLRAFVLSAESSGGQVAELLAPMTFTMTYGVGQVTGVNTPQLYARSAASRGMADAWDAVPVSVNLGARTVTAQATRMTEYVLVAAPGARVYVPIAVRP
jgi:hypothetical protein